MSVILSQQTLSTPGIYYTEALENVINIDIQAIPSEDAAGQVRCTVQRRTTNGAWRTATDAYGVPLTFTVLNNNPAGITIGGVYARYLRVKVEILGGTGTLDIETEVVSADAPVEPEYITFEGKSDPITFEGETDNIVFENQPDYLTFSGSTQAFVFENTTEKITF